MKDSAKQKNIRLPALTQQQIEELCAKTGMTITHIIIAAVDRMHAEEIRTKSKEVKE